MIRARPIASANGRKYSVIWNNLKTFGLCSLKTTHVDSLTIINGVKKEKNKDKNRPKNKVLKIDTEEIPSKIAGEPSEIKVHFRLIEDTSINNI